MSLGHLHRELGTVNALLYLASRTLSLVSAGQARLVKYYITGQPVRTGNLTPPGRGKQIEVHEATVEEALWLPVERPRHVIDARLRNGGRCLVARKQDALTGFQWFTLHDYPEDEVRCLFRLVPEDRCAWDYDIFVLPEWRTQPVFTRLRDTCNQILRGAGVRYTLSRIDAYNAQSRRAHERIGARIIGWACFLCAGPLQVSIFSASPWLHVGVSARQRPTLYVSRMAMAARAEHFSG